MPLIFVALALLLLLVLLVLSVPLSLVQRYRTGTVRRPARGWVATVNLVSLVVSVTVVLLTAAVTSLWVPRAFAYTLIGLAVGVALGLLGLFATRWEATPGALHFTPNRWLVLVLMIVVTARILYGFWRAWGAWQRSDEVAGWLAEAGVAGSLGVGAVVLGYALAYQAGVRARAHRHASRPDR